MKELLRKLTQLSGPSGYEDAVRETVRKEVKGLADEVRVDALGNLIVRKGRVVRGGKRIMVAAHLDEIGLIVTHVDDKGFARFSNVGTVFGRYALSGRVRFLNGAAGLIGYDRLENFHQTPSFEKMFLDLGATNARDCPVKVGDVAAFEREFLDLDDRVVAKSLDDRAGVTVMIEALKRFKPGPNEVYFVFTVQEEIHSRGAGGAAYGLNPDLGIAVDLTPSGDTPHTVKSEIRLGKGPAIKVKDQLMLADPRIVKWMSRTAERAKVPYQLEVLLRGSTDAQAMQLVRAGIPVGCVSIPVRYVHSPSEMIDMSDMENSVRLLTALLKSRVEL